MDLFVTTTGSLPGILPIPSTPISCHRPPLSPLQAVCQRTGIVHHGYLRFKHLVESLDSFRIRGYATLAVGADIPSILLPKGVASRVVTKFAFAISLVAMALVSTDAPAQMRLQVGPHQEIQWDKAPPDARPTEDRPPNIVLILADDLGWNDLTFGGGGIAGGTVPTPNIDSLASQGARFTNGYSACGTCAPSRAAIMSGRYPTRFGFEFTPTPPQMLPMIARSAGKVEPPLITYFDDYEPTPYELMGMPTEEITLAETLKTAGYEATFMAYTRMLWFVKG